MISDPKYSRGALLRDSLLSTGFDHLQQFASDANEYNGVNLLCGTLDQVYFAHNYEQLAEGEKRVVELEPDLLQSFSNGRIHDNWGKE